MEEARGGSINMFGRTRSAPGQIADSQLDWSETRTSAPGGNADKSGGSFYPSGIAAAILTPRK